MEEKNNIMGNIPNDNMKKYLIIGGLVFTIFVVGIVIAKFAFGGKKDNTQVILPPEPVQQTQKRDTDLFNSIPVENDNGVSKDKAQKPKEEVVKQQTLNDNESPKQVEQATTEFKKPAPQPQPKPAPVTEPKPEVKKIVTQPKKVVAKPKSKKSKKVVVRNYYIQVAAVTRGEPSKKFLKIIIKNGFKYKIVSVEIKGKKIKRVMVGPFSRYEAKKALPKVKSRITASAFIKKVK